MTMIFDVGGIPAAPSLQKYIRECDPSLSLVWFMGHWCVMYRWPESDARWQAVREGTCNPADAHDVLCRLPADCSPDDARSYIERVKRDWGSRERDDIVRLIDQIHEHNDKQAEKNIEEQVMQYTDELLDANKRTLLGEFGKTTARVFQSEPSSTKGKKRRKWAPAE